LPTTDFSGLTIWTDRQFPVVKLTVCRVHKEEAAAAPLKSATAQKANGVSAPPGVCRVPSAGAPVRFSPAVALCSGLQAFLRRRLQFFAGFAVAFEAGLQKSGAGVSPERGFYVAFIG